MVMATGKLERMELPTLSEQLGDKPAPPELQSVQAFVNTLDLEEGTDLLEDRRGAEQWLRREGLIGTRTRLESDQLPDLRGIREGLRALLAHNNGGPAPTASDLRPLRALAATHRPQLGVDASGRLRLGPASGRELGDGLLGLLIAVRDAQSDGKWSRLKVCGNPDCRWAFFDRSRNRGGTWCNMAVCGNRLKNRHFRARHR